MRRQAWRAGRMFELVGLGRRLQGIRELQFDGFGFRLRRARVVAERTEGRVSFGRIHVPCLGQPVGQLPLCNEPDQGDLAGRWREAVRP